MPEEILISVKDLTVRRGQRRVLDGLSFDIQKGPPLAIMGESGSGKTTLLYCMLGLISAEKGEVRIQNLALTRMPPRERAKRVGLVFQDYALFPHLTVLENITLAPRLHGLARETVTAQAVALLGDLGLEGREDQYPHELSGGQKQRVAIARALVLKPALLFMDEPSAALDERTTEDLAWLLVEINERTQIVVVSHDRYFVDRSCGRTLALEKGRLHSV